MPTSNYDAFDRWLDGIFGNHIKTHISVNSIGTKNEPVPVLTTPDVVSPFEIQSVLSNRKKNAFTVVWTDGTHTTVHCQSGDKWDDEKALAMCFTKKALGNKGNFNDKFNDALDNKMKVIPTESAIKMSDSSISFTRPITLNAEAVKKMTEAPEKECNCDGTCEKCECKDEAEKFIEEVEALKKKKNAFGLSKQTTDELTKVALKANNSLKEMINALTGETEKPEGKEYKVFVKANGAITPAGTYHDAKSAITCVKELATEHFGRKPYYYRCWMEGDKMVIDFGSYSKFIIIQGMTPDEWIKD